MASIAEYEKNLWNLVGDEFDNSLERLTAIVIKESDTTRYFSYPTPLENVGYYFDFSEKTVYDNPPKFSLNFGVYSYPDLRNSSSRNHVLYKKCRYYPSMVMREYTYSNIGLMCSETFGNVIEGAFTWDINMRSVSEGGYSIDKSLFTVLSSDEPFCIKTDGNNIQVIFDDVCYFIANRDTIRVGLYEEENRMKADIAKDKLSQDVKKGHYMVIAHTVSLGSGESHTIRMGLGSVSKEISMKALEPKNTVEEVSLRWNNWYNSLPKLNFTDDREKKAYYKCWWTIKTNYYNHPKWGFSVTESLPVYKGLWQWAIPSVEWHSDQNTEYTSLWIKKAMNMLVDSQREDGYITHAIYIDEEKPGERWARGTGVVQTPHLPWVAIRYYHATGDIESLKGWYGAFEKYYNYLCNTRDKEMKNLHLWAITTSYDTGLDTTAVFQRVTYSENGVSEEYCYPAIFAAERCRYEQAMAELSDILGLPGGNRWRTESEETLSAMNRILWDNKKKWYGVLHQDGTLDTRVGVDGLFALVYHLVDNSRAEDMKENFFKLVGPYGIRTVAPGEPGYRDNVYWRGAAWPKTSSLGTEVCRYYFPDLLEQVHDAVINMALARPNIWECYVASSGELARSDHGFICTPCMSSNVGAGDIIGSILLYHGFEMYGMGEVIPLIEMKNYHWKGMWISLRKAANQWLIKASKQENSAGTVVLISKDGETYTVEVQEDKDWQTVI